MGRQKELRDVVTTQYMFSIYVFSSSEQVKI